MGFFLVCAGVAHAEPGRTAGNTLLRDVAGRPAALGQAYSAVTDDLDSIGFNPAALATLPEHALSATYLNGLVDNSFGSFHGGLRTDFGSLFVGANYFD